MNMHLIPGLAAGGAERFLLNYLQTSKHESRVIVLRGRGFYSQEFEKLPLKITYLHLHRGNILGLIYLISLAWSQPSARLICWLSYSQIVGAVVKLLVDKVDLIFMYRQSIENYDNLGWLDRLILRLVVWASFKARFSVFNSFSSKEMFTSIGAQAEKSTVLHNGVDMGTFCFSEESRLSRRGALGFCDTDFVVLHIGRWHPEKGIDFALELARQMLDSTTGISFRFVGQHSKEFFPLRDLIAKSRRISFSAASLDVVSEYNAADVLLVTSRTESCPNVVLEAVANGLPIVSTDVGDVGCFVDRANLLEFGDYGAFSERIKDLRFERARGRLLASDGEVPVMDAKQCFDMLDFYFKGGN